MEEFSQIGIPNKVDIARGTASVKDLSFDEFRRYRRSKRLPAADDENAYRLYKSEYKNPVDWAAPVILGALGATSQKGTGVLRTATGAGLGASVGVIINKAMRLAKNRRMRQRIITEETADEYL